MKVCSTCFAKHVRPPRALSHSVGVVSVLPQMVIDDANVDAPQITSWGGGGGGGLASTGEQNKG
jgi:hypothetical protein